MQILAMKLVYINTNCFRYNACTNHNQLHVSHQWAIFLKLQHSPCLIMYNVYMSDTSISVQVGLIELLVCKETVKSRGGERRCSSTFACACGLPRFLVQFQNKRYIESRQYTNNILLHMILIILKYWKEECIHGFWQWPWLSWIKGQ